MRSTPEQDARLQARLQEAVDKFAGGSADAFARLIDYTNGGGVRQVLSGKRGLREAIIERVHRHPLMRDWFKLVLSPISTADIEAAHAEPPTETPGPEMVLDWLGDLLSKAPQNNIDELAETMRVFVRSHGARRHRAAVLDLIEPATADANEVVPALELVQAPWRPGQHRQEREDALIGHVRGGNTPPPAELPADKRGGDK